MSRRALDPDLAAVGLDQLAGDRQAQAAATPAHPPGVNLAEFLEDQLDVLLRDADGGVAYAYGDARWVALSISYNIGPAMTVGRGIDRFRRVRARRAGGVRRFVGGQRTLGRDCDRAALGELGGVREQVEQDLPDLVG